MQDIAKGDCPRNDAETICTEARVSASSTETFADGRYHRKRQPMAPETRERIRQRLKAHYSDPENREAAVKRMARPAVRQRISERTAAALAKPATKELHKAGLAAAWEDPGKREQQAELTRTRMAAWRARRLEAAETVLRQLPIAEREQAMAALADAAGMGKRP